jgi:hypothetical protein
MAGIPAERSQHNTNAKLNNLAAGTAFLGTRAAMKRTLRSPTRHRISRATKSFFRSRSAFTLATTESKSKLPSGTTDQTHRRGLGANPLKRYTRRRFYTMRGDEV